MLAFEQSHRPQFFNHLDFEAHLAHPYPGLDMNQYSSVDSSASFASLPFSYYENPSLFAEAPHNNFRYGMYRTTSSNGSVKQASHSSELPPSLLSSVSGPSVHSASSSTVGSPFSGHSHPVSHQESWTSNQGLGLNPTIVNHDGFANDFVGAEIDSELALDKFSGSFVGECADLSSFHKRSSTFPINVSHSLSVPQHPLYTASPELMSIDSFDISSTNSASTHPNNAHSFSHPPARPAQSDFAPRKPVFKSPTTPASAHPRRASVVSPTVVRTSAAQSAPTTSLAAPVPAVNSHSVNSTAAPMPQHASQFHSHFFAQSSGSFMPPLESSYPSLIQGPRTTYADGPVSFSEQNIYHAQPQTYHNMSPAQSPASSPTYNPHPATHFSPHIPYCDFHTQPEYLQRRASFSSHRSGQSHQSPVSSEYDDETKEKGRCPHPECGRVFKDLKAHMLTHQSERPEKCPILHCEYNQKGFARKYDKNRHTLTHYKGTMVCGFCPGSGSAAEKSFNRADVFKRHLTSVHGVEQTAPNSRKRSPSSSNKKLSSYCQDATGKCSTCSSTFTNAQDFYEHLDDCVLRVVQQEEGSEAVNAMHLAEMAGDEDVKDTLERHMLNANEETIMTADDEDDDDEDEDEDEDDPSFSSRSGKGTIKSTKATGSSRAIIGGGIQKPGRPGKKGLTHSKGGVPVVGKGRKKRKNYPPSWGMSAEKMQMKKRVLCVYDGERRLWKDDLMMHNEFEVRMKLADGKSYVTDLDVETVKRAEGFHNASDEEKGPWVREAWEQEQPPFDYEAFMS